jgi:hypothetical protein
MRRQTLEALIASSYESYESLSGEERHAFGRLTVSPGSFTSKAAAALFDERDDGELRPINVIASLLDKSLIAALDHPRREAMQELNPRAGPVYRPPRRFTHPLTTTAPSISSTHKRRSIQRPNQDRW